MNPVASGLGNLTSTLPCHFLIHLRIFFEICFGENVMENSNSPDKSDETAQGRFSGLRNSLQNDGIKLAEQSALSGAAAVL